MTISPHYSPTEYLSPRELAMVGVEEEAAEVIKELCKARRFTLTTPSCVDGTTAVQRLSEELGDLLGSIQYLLKTHPEIDQVALEKHRIRREGRLRFFNNPANW